MNKEQRLDEFNEWVFEMDDVLEEFLRELPENISSRLDFSDQSLNVIEDWILTKYPQYQLMQEKTEADTLDKLARYIGETFRKNVGGYWDIELENEKDIYYNFPVITDYDEEPVPLSPHSLAVASADRRTGNYLSEILQNIVEDQKGNEI